MFRFLINDQRGYSLPDAGVALVVASLVGSFGAAALVGLPALFTHQDDRNVATELHRVAAAQRSEAASGRSYQDKDDLSLESPYPSGMELGVGDSGSCFIVAAPSKDHVVLVTSQMGEGEWVKGHQLTREDIDCLGTKATADLLAGMPNAEDIEVPTGVFGVIPSPHPMGSPLDNDYGRGAKFTWSQVEGADLRVETSADGGRTWKFVADPQEATGGFTTTSVFSIINDPAALTDAEVRTRGVRGPGEPIEAGSSREVAVRISATSPGGASAPKTAHVRVPGLVDLVSENDVAATSPALDRDDSWLVPAGGMLVWKASEDRDVADALKAAGAGSPPRAQAWVTYTGTAPAANAALVRTEDVAGAKRAVYDLGLLSSRTSLAISGEGFRQDAATIADVQVVIEQ